jgi:4-amino-4-deoxy-L-arabinose transferase-like glycosyltransferase
MAGNLWLRGGAAADAPTAPAPTLRHTPAPPTSEPARGSRLARLVARPELLGLLALAAILNLWSLDANGWANTYYSAAVRSMTESWHAFIYGSFDPSGVMTVDKPPLALWVQALSARVFGLSSWSILVPQALMGVAAVGLTYDLTRRRFGRLGGFVAGLALAITPVAVAVFRHNNPDALVLMTSVGALWAIVRALDDGRTRWLVLAGACVGLGFEAKMGAALLVVPALAVAYMWVAPRGYLASARQLLAGGASMIVVGGAWPLLVALTPAADRPYISGTDDNSIWSLILGYNGLGRLAGQAGGPGGNAGGFGGGGGNSLFGGETGPLRLLNEAMGAQAGWLYGFVIVGGLAILAASRLRRGDARTGWLIATGGAFLTIGVAFSYASGIFHPYYVSLLAPFTASLAGGSAAQLVRGGKIARIAAPLAVAAAVIVELFVIDDAGNLDWLIPVLVVAGAATAATLATVAAPRIRAAAVGIFLAAALAGPAIWSAQTLGHTTNGTFPAGGPATAGMSGPGGGGFRARAFGNGGGPPAGGGFGQRGQGGGFGGPGRGGVFGGSSNLTQVLAYTRSQGGGTVAVSSQSGASNAIIQSDADVAGIGGFSGRESEPSVAWFAEEVRSGNIRWVLTGGQMGGGMGGDARTGSSTVMTAVQSVCTAIPSSAYEGTSSGGDTTDAGSASSSGLYDCRGKADALAEAAA